MSKEAHTEKELNDPFELLTHLWAHKNVLHELENIRLNPNLLNKNKIRNDLEFYIPQLCSFMLFGEYEIVQEFFSFLCKSCYASFSFAHRIIWFLKSSIGTNPADNEKIRNMLHIIQTIFKSSKDKKCLESLYLSGSQDYISFLSKNKLNKHYFEKIASEGEIDLNDDNIKEFFNERQKFRSTLDSFVENQYDSFLEKSGLKKEQKENEIIEPNKITQNDLLVELNPKNIYLNLFQKYECVTNDENDIHMQYVKQIDVDDVNLSSFLSNINFIDHLCNLCDVLLNTVDTERKKTLLNEIKKINKTLPANVYIPFVNHSIRNYVIASIPVSEAKIFKTKERAPYMITIECFRLDELNYYLMNESIKVNMQISSEKEIEENYYQVNNTESDSKKEDGVTYLKNQSDFEIKNQKKRRSINLEKNMETLSDKIVSKNSISEEMNELGVTKTNIKHFSNQTQNKLKYLMENEVKFSKPIMISSFMKKNNQTKSEKKGLVKVLSNDSTSDSSKNSETQKKNHKKEYNKLSPNESDINPNTAPNEISNIIINTNQNSLLTGLNKYDQIEDAIKTNFVSPRNNNSSNITFSNNESLNNSGGKNQNNISLLNTSSPSPNDSSSDPESSSRSEEDQNEQTISSIVNQIDNNSGNLFGETIEQQTLRLRKISPFGHLSSYKLFNLIIKSGEDLRQEQFATQLINEFLQIFKFEKVKCWLQPYEIIATGTNVGIVEVVPNSMSIDQMKRKTKKSVSDFYKDYFGPEGSHQYKRAMKNYIQSLAGYSLVCYFLQIKDRHNANILIDDKGHLIHIDFGFMLSNAPGKGLKFERAPFKLTNELVDVMGGTNTKMFNSFRKLLWKGFIALVEHYEKILILVEMMYCGHGNNLPCFEAGQNTIQELRQRFIPRPGMKKRDYIAHVDQLISQSLDNWRTNWYDKFQYMLQGILP